MCTNKNITWQVTNNSVKNRMIDNSLIHTFVSSRKIQKRTKLLNAELRKYCGVKDYKEYIEFKTNILRYFEDNPDTDDPGYLTDVDYNIIYSSKSTQAKYVAERTKKYSFTSDVIYEVHKSNNTKNTKRKKKNESKNTEVQNKHRRQKNKSSGTKHNASNKHISIGWQEVVRQRDVSPLFDRTSADISNNEENTFESKNSSQSNNRFFSQRLVSQSGTSNTKKSVKKKTRKNNRDVNVTINKLHSDSEDNLFNVTEITSENKVQNYKHQNILLNDSNSELDSLSSHYNATPSKSTEKINDSNSELNYMTQNSQDSIVSNGKIEVLNKSKEQIFEHQDAAANESDVELESQSLHNTTPPKSTEKIIDFNNELNLITSNIEDGIISSKIEVFNENKEDYGHQDAALKELKTEFESQSSPREITPSKSTEKINDFNNEVDPVAPNFEDGIISSKIEVFDESKKQTYGHQDAPKESNVEFESQNSHSKITPSKSTEKVNDLNNEVNSVTLNLKDDILSNKIEVSNESKVEIDEHQDTTLNKSNTELDTRSPHYKTTLSKSKENISDTSLITLEENNSDKLTQTNNKNPINTDNCNSRTSYKSKLLKNVRRNLTSVLEEVNFTNNEKNINTDKNRKNGLNHDQLSTVNSSTRSTPLKKRRIDVHELCNSPLDTLSLDQQKDSGFDDDSQDKFVKIKKSDIKSPSRNTAEKIFGSPEYPKRITDVPDMEDSKEDVSDTHLENYDNYLREQNNKEVTESEEKGIKNSSPNKDEELSTINQEDKTHSVKVEKLCKVKKQHSLSPKQNRTKLDADSKSNGCILEKRDNRKVKKLLEEEEEIKNFQYDQNDKDAEISINQKDKMHFVNKEDLSDIKKQQLLSPKQGCLKDTHSKFDSNIVEEQSSKHKETKKSFDEEEVKNSPELNRVHKDTKISTEEDKMHIVESESDIKKPSLSPKKEYKKDEQSRSCTNISDERDNKEVLEKEVKDFYQSDEIDKDKISPINKNETHTKLKDECDTKKLQLPIITCTEIINTKYKIINKKFNDINSDIEEVDNINATSKHTPADNNASINCSSVDWQDKATDVEEIDNISMMEETVNEEENTFTYMSPQTQKRLQQQARLNLVNSDSSESDSEAEDIAETSRKSIDNSDSDSDANCSSKNDIFNDHAREKINADISSGEDIRVRSERASISAEDTMKQNATNTKKGIKKKSDEAALSTKCIYENSLRKSAANKGPLRETRCSENVNDNGDERNEHVGDIERSSLIDPPNSRENSLSGFSLRISESNVSCNNDDSNGFSRDFRSSSLNKGTARNETNQSEHSVCTDNLETSSKPLFDISYGRPYNLQQLVEDQKLLVETLPVSFTLADISDDDEAFILNIPNKVLQYNLQDELLTIKGDTIKFGKNKYKIVRKKVGTTSCVFATGKKRKPYKIVNINEISTVTVRERLPPYAEKSDILASHNNVTSTKSKSSKINNRQTVKRDSKILEVSGHKRKRCTSDFEAKQSAIKKKRSKISPSRVLKV